MLLLSLSWTHIPLAATPTRALQTGGDDLLHIWAVEVSLHDTVKRHIWPEHKLLAVMEVQCDGVFQVVEEEGVFWAMWQNLSDVDAVGEQQHWLWT